MPKSFVINEQLPGNENFDTRNAARYWLKGAEEAATDEQYSEEAVVKATVSRLQQGTVDKDANLTEEEVRDLLLKLVAFSPKVAKEVLKTATESADTTKVIPTQTDQQPLTFTADNEFFAEAALEEKPKQEEEIALDKIKKERTLAWIAQVKLTDVKFDNKISTSQNILHYRVDLFKSNDPVYFTAENISPALEAAKSSLTLAEKLFEPRGFWVTFFYGADYFAQNITKEQIETFLKEESDLPLHIREHVRNRVLKPNFAEKRLLGTSLDRFFNETEIEAIRTREFKLVLPQVPMQTNVTGPLVESAVVLEVQKNGLSDNQRNRYGDMTLISPPKEEQQKLKARRRYGDMVSISAGSEQAKEEVLSDLGANDSASVMGDRTRLKLKQGEEKDPLMLQLPNVDEDDGENKDRVQQFIAQVEDTVTAPMSEAELDMQYNPTTEEQEALKNVLERANVLMAEQAATLAKQQPATPNKSPANRMLNFDDNASTTSSSASSTRMVTHLQPQSPDREKLREEARLKLEREANEQRNQIAAGVLSATKTGLTPADRSAVISGRQQDDPDYSPKKQKTI